MNKVVLVKKPSMQRQEFDNVVSIKEVSDNLNKKEYDKKLKKS